MGLGLAFGEVELARFLSIAGVRQLLMAASLFPLIWIAGLAFEITRRRVERPAFALFRMVRWRKRWLSRGAFFLLVVVLFVRCFSSFKVAIPTLNPFWADPWLADLDHMTFGTDPWILTHAIFGSFETLLLDRIYILWFAMMALTTGWVCFASDPKLQLRGLLCYVLNWSVLGGATAVGFSSVGPCFYEQFYSNARFAPLMSKLETINTHHELMAFRTMSYLKDSLGKDYIGGGISAMPSLHVAMALLSFLCVYNYSKSISLKVLSGLFGIAILIGSVHLGWHYAWDGIFSIIAVSIFWWSTGRLVEWVERRETQRVHNVIRVPAAGVTALPATP